MMKKRILCMIVTILMCVSLLPVSGFAEELTGDEDTDQFYSVTAEECTGGTINLTQTEYKSGDTVEFTVSPDEGFDFTGLETDPETEITDDKDGNYSFIMSESDVRKSAVFEIPLTVDKGKFVSDFGVGAYDYHPFEWSDMNDAMEAAGFSLLYTCRSDQKLIKGGIDLNDGEGGKYIYLSEKFENNFNSNLVTGVILLKDSGHPNIFRYGGKNYKPISNSHQFSKSDGNLNQDVSRGGTLYLYYTTDGADKGDPVLSELIVTYYPNMFYRYDYVMSVNEYTDEEGTHTTVTAPGDVAENGAHVYLYQKFHTHTLSHKYDENYHWDVCTECEYVSAKEPHNYSYVPLDNGYQHDVVCSCRKYTENHTDADGDLLCDVCSAKLAAKADGLFFDTFLNAWNYAVWQNHDVTINVLKNAMITETPEPLRNRNTVIVTGAKGVEPAVIELVNKYFSVENGTLIIDNDVSYYGLEMEKMFRVSGTAATLCIKSGNISAKYTYKSGNETIIDADKSSEVVIMNGNISGAAYALSAKGCWDVNISGGDLSGTEAAVSAKACHNIAIKYGTFSGDKCGLFLDSESHAEVTGGTFRSGGSCSIKVDNGRVKDIFPAGYNCYREDTGKRVEIEDEAGTVAENVTVKYIPFNISITYEGNGVVECSAKKASFGEIIQLVVKREPGNHLEKWETSDVSISGENTFVMPDKDVRIKAVFKENESVSYLDESRKAHSVTVYDKLTPYMTTLPAGWYVVDGKVSIDSRIETNGDIHLILKDGSTLEAKNGIHVGSSSSLTVYGQGTGDNAGAVYTASQNDYYNSPIGGNADESSGEIIINGGNIISKGTYGAGIGGGGGKSKNKGGTGTVIINGGRVEAESNYGAGIGGGYNMGKGVVTINRGTVIGTCNYYGAGIGGGMYGEGEVSINDGTVNASGNGYAAGIGSSGYSYTGWISITGGTVDAVSKSSVAGAICAGKDGFIRIFPFGRYSLEVKTENNQEITGSPFNSEIEIADKLEGKKEVHIKKVLTEPVIDTVTISFNMNGHGGEIPAQTVSVGSLVSRPADPQDSGYTFKGWYGDCEFKIPFDFDATVNADTVIYAKWEKNQNKPTNPNTGDENNKMLWIILTIAGAALLTAAVIGRKIKICRRK